MYDVSVERVSLQNRFAIQFSSCNGRNIAEFLVALSRRGLQCDG